MSDYTDTLARAVTRYGADSPEVARLLPELREARSACRAARWPELHRDDCEWCAYFAAGAPGALLMTDSDTAPGPGK